MTGPRVGGGWDIGSACHELNLVGCKDRRTRVRAPARDPPTLPDPVLYTVIVSYIYALENPIKKILKKKKKYTLGNKIGKYWSL